LNGWSTGLPERLIRSLYAVGASNNEQAVTSGVAEVPVVTAGYSAAERTKKHAEFKFVVSKFRSVGERSVGFCLREQ
jgi:hypothetical protein